MYFFGCLPRYMYFRRSRLCPRSFRFVRFLATLSADYGVVALGCEVGEEFSAFTDLAA